MTRLHKFWLVSAPSRLDNTVNEIVFEVNPDGCWRLNNGDLRLPALFDNRDEALAEARRRLDVFREYQRTLSADV